LPRFADGTTGETTDETTIHSAKPPKNGGKAAGYSHLTKLQTAQQVIGYSHLTDETTSQSTKPPKYGGKVAGYKAASCQVIGYRNDIAAGHPRG
jgi:hypothetical protein